MSNIKLSSPDFQYIARENLAHDHSSVVTFCRILTVGSFTDMNGTKVEITPEVIIKLVQNHNDYVEKEYNKWRTSLEEMSTQLSQETLRTNLQITLQDFDSIPNQINHDLSDIKCTVGNVIGKMQVMTYQGQPCICCFIKVKGVENVKPVLDNRWRNLSVGYNADTLQFSEVSWVIYGADPNANKIMGNNITNSLKNTNNYVQTLSIDDIISQSLLLQSQLENKIKIKHNLMRLCINNKITRAESLNLSKSLCKINDNDTLDAVFDVLYRLKADVPKSSFIKLSHAQSEIFREQIGLISKVAREGIFNIPKDITNT